MFESREFLILAVVLTLLSLPLAFGWIKPNYFYGVRTRASLADPIVWERVNRFFGRAGLVAGLVTAMLSRLPRFEPDATWLPLGLLLAPFAGAIGLTLAYQHRVVREQGGAS